MSKKYRFERLNWYSISKFKKQAILIQPDFTKLKDNTPESFYHHELVYRSTLEERYYAHRGEFDVNAAVLCI